MPTAQIEDMINQLDGADQEKVISYIAFLVHDKKENSTSKNKSAYGIARGKKAYAEGFDIINGGNDEIAEMFGV